MSSLRTALGGLREVIERRGKRAAMAPTLTAEAWVVPLSWV
jgi:hypothetical protein